MSTSSSRAQTIGLVGWLLLCLAVMALSGAGSLQAGGFYAELTRPDWAPPPWLFGPVWLCLYAMMAVAAWRVWRRHGFGGARVALSLFMLQLAFNAAWSWLFFAWRHGGLALLDIVLLMVSLTVTLIAFWRADRAAGALLLPYLLWVEFAAMLNYSLLQLNPQLLSGIG